MMLLSFFLTIAHAFLIIITIRRRILERNVRRERGKGRWRKKKEKGESYVWSSTASVQISSGDISEVNLWSDHAQIWSACSTLVVLNSWRWRFQLEFPVERYMAPIRAGQKLGKNIGWKILVLGKLFSCQGFLRYDRLILWIIYENKHV